MTAAVEADELAVRYGRSWVLRDCCLRLPIGSVVALIGPNGAGKTTLLHLVAGLLRPAKGTIKVFGEDAANGRAQAMARVGFVAQDHPLYPGFSVADLLRMGRGLNACAGTRCWPSADWPTSTFRSRPGSGSCPAVSSPRWPWPWPWASGHHCWSSTSPWPTSTRSPAEISCGS